MGHKRKNTPIYFSVRHLTYCSYNDITMFQDMFFEWNNKSSHSTNCFNVGCCMNYEIDNEYWILYNNYNNVPIT